MPPAMRYNDTYLIAGVVQVGYSRGDYDAAYKRDNYYIARTLLPIDKRDDVQQYAACHGISVSTLIRDALQAYTGIDLSRKD